MEEEVLTRNHRLCNEGTPHPGTVGFSSLCTNTPLIHELAKAGPHVECQKPIKVWYDGIIVGDFLADMLIEGRIIIENKAIHNLTLAHEVQLVNYLTATGLDIGLLINFGADSLQFRRKHRTFKPTSVRQD